jgi:serine/threonine protein kinase/Tol biopolymer transport system component
MPLAPGTKVGPYAIVALLGAGGMGEVYRARDGRLKRDVALKLIPAAFADDPQRLGRLEREAQVLASFSHPNVASIYGFEESGATRALVMELVEGPTLAERIAGAAMPLAEALPIARQIAEALEFAHERGIIHRDLKPANVKLAPGDCVKVLDFGLAKALSDDSAPANIADSPTLSAAATRAGLILGTPAYMSPEQARAKPTDRRTDIWSFGCVLFEMLTGRMAFAGETITDTLAAVLTQNPRFDLLPPSTPPRIRQLIERCLQKDAKQRLQAIGDARIEIDDALTPSNTPAESHIPAATTPQSSAPESSMPRPFARFVTVAVAFVVLAAAALWWFHARQPKALAWTGGMISGPNIAFGGRISPDGHTLAFQAMIDNLTQVAVTSPDTGDWTMLSHDRQHGFVDEISWAPDGSKIYFDRTIGTPVGIYSIPALGGDERLVLANAGSPEALPDGSLLVIHPDSKGYWRIHHYWPDSQRLEPLPGWVAIGTTIPLRVFPDGKEAVFNGTETATDVAVHLYVMDIATGKTHLLAPGLPSEPSSESYPIAVTADGREVLVDAPAGDLHRLVAVPRDGRGPIRTLLTLTRPPWYIDAAKDGTVYLDQVDRPHEILRFSLRGGAPQIVASSDSYAPAGHYMEPVEITDGRFLLDTAFSGRGRLLVGKPDSEFVPLLDTAEETSSPAVSLVNGEAAFVLGSGNDQTIAIASTVDGRLIRRLNGTKGRRITGLGASPDSATLYFGADGFIWAISASDGTPQKIAPGESVTVSPDGRTLVVTQNQESNPTFVSVALSGSASGASTPKQIHIDSSYSIAPVSIGSRALSRDGKLLINVSVPDSWFYRVIVLDLATGHITRIPVTYAGDVMSGNWTSDGQVLSVGLPLRSHIWRFRSSSQ